MPDVNLFCSSNISFGAINKSSLGSTFSVSYPQPINIPPNAKNIQVWCHSLGAYYTFPNISTAKNNNKIYFTDDVANYEKYVITIPNGLYSVDLLSDAVSYALNQSGFSPSLFSFSGDLATGKVILSYDTAGYAVYMKTGQSPYVLLGFNAEQKIPASGYSTSTSQYTAPNVADFGSLESITLQCSLVNTAYNNGKTSNVLASIPIEVSAGQNIVYNPSNLIKVDAPNLAGSTISLITFVLGDQNAIPLDMADEDYSLRVVIHYEL
jgi:hypothetical protein